MTPPPAIAARTTPHKLLKRTVSRCPRCHVPCPAEVLLTGDSPAQVLLNRTCPDHGETSVCIASDARFYWLARGKAGNDCCSGADGCCSADGSNQGSLGSNAQPGDAIGVMEKLATCLCLIEIVNSCNLSCPTCYANSPLGVGQKVDAVPLADLQRRIQGVIDRKGKIELLQLSGGEPTLHPRFFELLRWLHSNPGIDYVLLNTNGIRIATDASFADELARTFRYGRFQLYLQFDGPQSAGQESLRGADLRTTREHCLERCRQMNLPVTLAMTVVPQNLPFLWDTIEFGLRWPNVRGVSFQPAFQSGRQPNGNHATRLNTADVILAAVEQSRRQLRYDDFTPLPCGDPNCAAIGYLLRLEGQVRSVSDFIDFKSVQGFLATKVRYKLEDLMKCGCESEPLGELLRQFELDETHTFRLFIKPFMDALTWDEDRIDRCCTHVIRPDGKLDSFCRYYSGFSETPAPTVTHQFQREESRRLSVPPASSTAPLSTTLIAGAKSHVHKPIS
jgi:7,8-dihydro-6-hydroxymethylpterin dimethyltransferase